MATRAPGPGVARGNLSSFVGIGAIGCENSLAWKTLARIAIDCAPAIRTTLIRELLRRDAPARTSDIATAVKVVTKTASRYLEDLAILKIASRTKQTDAANAPDYWEATDWLRMHFPQSKTEKYAYAHDHYKEADRQPAPQGTFQSHSGCSCECHAGTLPALGCTRCYDRHGGDARPERDPRLWGGA